MNYNALLYCMMMMTLCSTNLSYASAGTPTVFSSASAQVPTSPGMLQRLWGRGVSAVTNVSNRVQAWMNPAQPKKSPLEQAREVWQQQQVTPKSQAVTQNEEIIDQLRKSSPTFRDDWNEMQILQEQFAEFPASDPHRENLLNRMRKLNELMDEQLRTNITAIPSDAERFALRREMAAFLNNFTTDSTNRSELTEQDLELITNRRMRSIARPEIEKFLLGSMTENVAQSSIESLTQVVAANFGSLSRITMPDPQIQQRYDDWLQYVAMVAKDTIRQELLRREKIVRQLEPQNLVKLEYYHQFPKEKYSQEQLSDDQKAYQRMRDSLVHPMVVSER